MSYVACVLNLNVFATVRLIGSIVVFLKQHCEGNCFNPEKNEARQI